jgi:hypothetical protein
MCLQEGDIQARVQQSTSTSIIEAMTSCVVNYYNSILRVESHLFEPAI